MSLKIENKHLSFCITSTFKRVPYMVPKKCQFTIPEGLNWQPFEGPSIYIVHINIYILFFGVANTSPINPQEVFSVLASFHEIFLGSVWRALHDVVLDGASKKHGLLTKCWEETPRKKEFEFALLAIGKLTSFKKTCVENIQYQHYGI